jgi:hypothetical protein
MTGQDVDDLLSDLNDPDRTLWTLADRIRWMNAGVREIASAKPKAMTVSDKLAITAGLGRQSVDTATVVAVLDVTGNLGVDGNTPGRPVTVISADRLAASVPSWRTDKGNCVRHVVLDDRDPKSFIVWPAIKSGTWYLEALLQKHPAPIEDVGDTLPLDDSYLNPLAEYVMHMAYARDGESPEHASLSMAHYTKFAQILGIQVQRQKRAAAIANSAENPAYPAVDKNAA